MDFCRSCAIGRKGLGKPSIASRIHLPVVPDGERAGRGRLWVLDSPGRPRLGRFLRKDRVLWLLSKVQKAFFKSRANLRIISGSLREPKDMLPIDPATGEVYESPTAVFAEFKAVRNIVGETEESAKVFLSSDLSRRVREAMVQVDEIIAPADFPEDMFEGGADEGNDIREAYDGWFSFVCGLFEEAYSRCGIAIDRLQASVFVLGKDESEAVNGATHREVAPDGPAAPNSFIYNGIRYDLGNIQPKPFEVLAYFWKRLSESSTPSVNILVSELGHDVWGDCSRTYDGMKAAVCRAMSCSDSAGLPFFHEKPKNSNYHNLQSLNNLKVS